MYYTIFFVFSHKFIVQQNMNKHHLNIGQSIQQFRIKKGLTQNELADKMNTTQQAISLLEKDERGAIPLARLVEIADALDINTAELLGIQRVVVNIENNQADQPVVYNYETIQIEFPTKLIEQYEQRIIDLKKQIEDLRKLLKKSLS